MICRRTLFTLPLLLLLTVPGLVFAEGIAGDQDAAASVLLAPETSVKTVAPSDQNTSNTPASSEKTPKKPKPSASPDSSPSGNPSSQPSPTTEASPGASPDAPVQAMTADESPEPSIPKPVQSDPIKFLDGFKGNYDTDLFTGSATFSFPLAIPPGRGKTTPTVSLNYSSSGLNIQSPVGFGWSLPTNAIFRSTAYGTNNLYNRNDYAADIFGNYAQLIVTDTTNGIYSAKTEGAFISYDFDPPTNSWTATDKEGTKYFFGTSAASRHTDPDNASLIYKWLLDKVQDTSPLKVSRTTCDGLSAI